MIAQQKLLRVFTLIRLLKQRPGRTIAQLAQALDIDKRSVYRYLTLLEEVGYEHDLDEHQRYFLFEDETTGSPTFTEDEAELLRQALTSLPADSLLVGSIRQKVFLASTHLPLADGLIDLHQGRIVQRLAEALRDRKQVQLIRYQSTNSNSITDRLVEPLSFSDDYAKLTAYEPEAGKVKTFKTRRIDAITVLDTPITYRAEEAVLDLFDWSGPHPIPVVLRLTSRAYRLLIEDYPPTRAYVSKQEDDAFPYRLDITIRDFRGIGRFILGLPGEIRVAEPTELTDYLRERIREFEFW